jgi:hypothetical protein
MTLAVKDFGKPESSGDRRAFRVGQVQRSGGHSPHSTVVVSLTRRV